MKGFMSGGATRARILLAFLLVYVVWGSTYLAIRYAVETIPPFLMGGVRFLIAGGILYAVSRARGHASPTLANWRATAVIGALLFLGGNGLLSWSEQFTPSGVAALLVATVSLWMVILAWIHHDVRPDARVVGGVLLGFGGLALLVGPEKIAGGGRVPFLPALALMVGSFCWAAGSILAKKLPIPKASSLAASMEMITGGASMVLLGLVAGEGSRFHPSQFSVRSLVSLGYLVVFGALVGFSAYAYLLVHSSASRVATYAYVNPVIAVFLGWALAGEPLTARILSAAAITIGGVVVIVSSRAQPGGARVATPEPAE